MRRRFSPILLPLLLALVVAGSCAGPPESEPRTAIAFAIAIHGGAGTISRSIDESRKAGYIESLTAALTLGRDLLEEGAHSLDVAERVVRLLEDDPRFNAGKGAVFTLEGSHELDASIMDGRDLSCGAVTGVRTVKNPISLARMVMERTPHVMLAGDGAEKFAADMEVETVDPSYFDTERRRQQLLEAQKRAAEKQSGGGTVGVVALDLHGDLAAATSTGGTTNKMWGRIGDSPVIGAGTYADNRTCAVSCTGSGEEFIRHGVAHAVSSLVAHGGMTLQEAAEEVIFEVLKPGDGGLIAVGHDGSIAMVFNSVGMYRAAADSTGRFEVNIWE